MVVSISEFDQAWHESTKVLLEERFAVASECIGNTIRQAFEKDYQSASGRWDLEGFKLWFSRTMGPDATMG